MQTDTAAGASVEHAASSLGVLVTRELRSLREFGLARIKERVEALRAQGTPEAEQQAGNLYAACGLLAEARKAFARALGGGDPFAVRFNTGEVLLLGTRNERSLRAAVDEFTAALSLVPAGDLAARADTLLRLALAHRLAGNVDGEREALAQAWAIDPSLKGEYEALFETSKKGTVLSPNVRNFLLRGLK